MAYLTLEVILNIVAAFMVGIGVTYLTIGAFHDKASPLKFFALTWFLVLLQLIFAAISIAFNLPILHTYNLVLFIPMLALNIIFIDYVRYERITVFKLVVWGILSTNLWIKLIEAPISEVSTNSLGQFTLMVDPAVIQALTFLNLFNGIMMIYYIILILIRVPSYLKKPAWMAVFGAISFSVLTSMLIFLNVIQIIPGIFLLTEGIGALLIGISWGKNPKLAYILPFHAIRISMLNTESGIAIYNHSWSHKEDLVNDDLFAGMIQGISLIVKESVNQGNLKEMTLEQGVLIIARSNNLPIAGVIISTHSSKYLKASLEDFVQEFGERFQKIVATSCDLTQFNSASELVEKCFPLLPK